MPHVHVARHVSQSENGVEMEIGKWNQIISSRISELSGINLFDTCEFQLFFLANPKHRLDLLKLFTTGQFQQVQKPL